MTSIVDGLDPAVWEQTHALAYMGTTVDHLFPDCPTLLRSMRTYPNDKQLGRQCAGTVDVNGTDLCGWCVRVWKARNRRAFSSFPSPLPAENE